MIWHYIAILLWRGMRLRCPRCGKGKLFGHGYTMYETCSYCGWRFEREEGYWTGAMAVNLVITELLVAATVIPLAVLVAQGQLALVWALLFLPLPIVLPLLFYWHAKSLWMAVDFVLHPVALL
jgi:uncharacterized protein (DUF983 family)